jgi:hypothetical protein
MMTFWSVLPTPKIRPHALNISPMTPAKLPGQPGCAHRQIIQYQRY